MIVPLVARDRPLGALVMALDQGDRRYNQDDLALAQDLSRRCAMAIDNAQLYRQAQEAIARHRELEAELRESDRRKDEFLAILSHELRNPLAPIRNALATINRPGCTEGLARQARAIMDRQVRHLVRMVDDLLEVSRITRNKLEIRTERVELATVIWNAIETSRPVVEAAGHQLSIQVPTEPIHVEADLVRLAQVFSNLLNNAAKYTSPHGHIWLSAEYMDDQAVIRVRDNGNGIPPEMLPRIFEMFTQVDRRLEKTHGGLGIGLTLAKSLTELHGGQIEAHSAGLGCGSEFVVRLPVALAETASPADDASGSRPETGERHRRILVVDDNEDEVTTLAAMLRLMGNDIRTASDGLEALDVASDFRPEIVLLDIGMPRLNGYDTARRIRQQPWADRLCLIAVTGWGQESDRRQAREAGFDHHLVKPADPAELERLIRSRP